MKVCIKKIILLGLFVWTLLLSASFIEVSSAASCSWSGEDASSNTVAGCLEQDANTYKGFITAENYTFEDGVKKRIIAVADQIIIVTSLLSVGAIVFAGFLMVTAYGEDEKVKKGKNSLRWGLIGLAISMISFALVNAIVNLFYSIGG